MMYGDKPAAFQVNTGLLVTGAVLAAAGSMLGLAGLVISAAAVAQAGRRWALQRGTPPGEMARQQLSRARAATTAGAAAWRDGNVPSPSGQR